MKPFAPVDVNVIERSKASGLRPQGPGLGKAKGNSSEDSGLTPGPALRPEAWALRPVAKPVLALRRFRFPIPARVRTQDARPEYVAIDRRGLSGGGVESCAGPWRTAGDWWCEGWDRDEWDVTVRGGTTYRLFRARDTDHWFVDGVVD